MNYRALFSCVRCFFFCLFVFCAFIWLKMHFTAFGQSPLELATFKTTEKRKSTRPWREAMLSVNYSPSHSIPPTLLVNCAVQLTAVYLLQDDSPSTVCVWSDILLFLTDTWLCCRSLWNVCVCITGFCSVFVSFIYSRVDAWISVCVMLHHVFHLKVFQVFPVYLLGLCVGLCLQLFYVEHAIMSLFKAL